MIEKEYNVGSTRIKFFNSIPQEDTIKKLYDVCNDYFSDKDDYFYTSEEIKVRNRELKNEKN